MISAFGVEWGQNSWILTSSSLPRDLSFVYICMYACKRVPRFFALFIRGDISIRRVHLFGLNGLLLLSMPRRLLSDIVTVHTPSTYVIVRGSSPLSETPPTLTPRFILYIVYHFSALLEIFRLSSDTAV